MNASWQVLPAKRWEENCTGRYSRGLRNQIENILWICMNQTSLRYKSYSLSELARTLFPDENTINIQSKITHHRVIGDGCIWE